MEPQVSLQTLLEVIARLVRPQIPLERTGTIHP